MKKLKLTKIIASTFVIVSVFAFNPIVVSAEWKSNSTGWWYTEGNSYAKGWKLVDGNWYYFYSDGYMASDTTIGDYYLGYNGAWTESIPNSSPCYLEQEILKNISEQNPTFCIDYTPEGGVLKMYSIISNEMAKLKLTHPFEIQNLSSYNSSSITYENSKNVKTTFTCSYRMPGSWMITELNTKAMAVVKSITSDSMSELDKERAIHDWIVNNIKYGSSQYAPCDALISHVGNCVGYSVLAQKMFNIAGIESIIIEGTTGGEGHSWNMVHIDNKWRHVDVTWDDPISIEDVRGYDYFNLTDSQISVDHTWDTSKYPSAN